MAFAAVIVSSRAVARTISGNKIMHDTDTAGLYADHPHLACIDEMWGTPKCREYISRLLTDSRGGMRRGFDPKHASTIFQLLFEHDQRFPDLDDTRGGAWWVTDRSRRGNQD
jgi:hypothetical protein